MADILVSKIQVPSLPNDNLILKDAEARQDLSTALATVTGNPLNFSTRSAQKAVETVISLEPIQDLHGYDHPWVGGAGKNKLHNTGTTATINGVTFTVNSDGTVLVNGTASDNANFYIALNTDALKDEMSVYEGQSVVCSGCPSGGSDRSYEILFMRLNGSDAKVDTGKGVTLTIGNLQGLNVYVRINIASETVCNNLLFKPMIRLATETDPTFAPYSNICPIDGRTETSLVQSSSAIIYDPNSDGKYIGVDGNIGDSSSFHYSELLPVVSENYTYKYIVTSSGDIQFTTRIHGYDSSGEWVKQLGVITPPQNYGENTILFDVDSDVSFIRISQRRTNVTNEILYTNQITIQFSEKVYGGTVELEKGTVTVEWGYIASYNGETLPGEWISDRDVYAPGTTPTTDAEVCYKLATPRTIQLTPNEISLLSGVNVISSNADGISLTYRDGKVATLGDLDSLNVAISNALEGKVDEVSGKGLSTNDYTTAEKEKLAGISTGANKVETSTINGNVKIDNIETKVYDDTHTKAETLALMNKVKSTDQTPYLFRPIPPLSTPYIREKLVGASMVWNQMVVLSHKSGGFTAQSDTGIYSVDVYTNVDIQLISGHSYIVSVKMERTISTNNFISFVLRQTSPSLSTIARIDWEDGSNNGYRFVIIKPNSNTQISKIELNNYYGKKGFATGDTASYDDFYFIDLTLAFGTAIADRIYSMEQAQAGSGIAWIKSYGFLTSDYYANDAGSIQSVCADRKEIVGFNLWDEEWELGGYDGTTGEKNNYTNIIRCKNPINVIPGSTLYLFNGINNNGRICFYDAEMNFINTVTTVFNNSTVVPNNAYKMTFNADSNYGTTYKHDICINLSDSARNGTYEPYHKTTISLGHDELRGVMQLDTNNNLVYYGDEKASDGVIDRKFGIELNMSSLNWSMSMSGGFQASISGIKGGLCKLINSKYTYDNSISFKWENFGTFADKTIYRNSNATNYTIYVKDTLYTDLTSFKNSLTNEVLVYELATPTTEQSTPFTSPQYLFNGGTEEFIDYGVEQETRDIAVPVGHVTEYMGASDGTEIKDKFYLPTLPSYDGEYNLKCRIQNGLLTGLMWELIPDEET